MKISTLIGLVLVVASSSANAYQKTATTAATAGQNVKYTQYTLKCNSGAVRKTSSAPGGFGVTGYYATDNPYSNSSEGVYITAKSYGNFDASAKKVCNE
jgi:hypothetical protein